MKIWHPYLFWFGAFLICTTIVSMIYHSFDKIDDRDKDLDGRFETPVPNHDKWDGNRFQYDYSADHHPHEWIIHVTGIKGFTLTCEATRQRGRYSIVREYQGRLIYEYWRDAEIQK